MALKRLGRPAEALAQYRLVVNQDGSKVTTYGDDPKILCEYAELCNQLGFSDEAQNAYKRVLAKARSRRLGALPSVDPDTKDPKRLQSNAMLIAALQRDGRGDWTTATQIIRSAIALDPGNAVAHVYLGMIFKEQASWSDAKHEFETALKVDAGRTPAIASYIAGEMHYQGENVTPRITSRVRTDLSSADLQREIDDLHRLTSGSNSP